MPDEPVNEPATGTEPAQQQNPKNDPASEPAQQQPAKSNTEPASQPQAATAGDDPDGNWRERAREWEKRSKANKAEVDQLKATQTKLQEALDSDKAERTRQMDALAIALGIKSGDEPPDPEKLAAELKAAQEKAQTEISQRDTAIKQSQIELAVLRNAGKHGANGDALLDSRSFMAKANGLDPSADGFADELAEAIKAAVEDGPQYKAAGPAPKDEGKNGSSGGGQNGDGGKKPPARSGGEHTTPGGNRQWTREEVVAAGKKDPQAVLKAMNDGLLVDLGIPPGSKR